MGLFDPWGHRRFIELLSLYIDHRLDGPRVAILEEHLATCATCQEELHTLRATVSLLQALPQAIPRRSFTLAERPQVSRASPAYLWGMRAVTAMASLALAVVLVGDFLGAFSRDIALTREAVPEAAAERGTDAGTPVIEAEAESAAPSLASEAATPQADFPAIPDAPLPQLETETEETLPVTALKMVIGSLVALLAIVTLLATWRFRRRSQLA